MHDKYINPFPPIGIRRMWSKEYIQSRSRLIDIDVKWTCIGKLLTQNIDVMRDYPGLYSFVATAPNVNNLPIDLREILYVGKADCVKKRLYEYIDDKKCTKLLASSKRKVRDNIRILFQEYGDDILVYCCEVPQDLITTFEDAFIQIIDPMLNSNQRLNEDTFINYEKSVSADFLDATPAFLEDVNLFLPKQLIDDSNEPIFTSALGNPVNAF